MTGDLQRLTAALDRIPQLARVVFILSAMDGFSYREIAFRLGISVKEVEGHMADALFLLNRLMRAETPPP